MAETNGEVTDTSTAKPVAEAPEPASLDTRPIDEAEIDREILPDGAAAVAADEGQQGDIDGSKDNTDGKGDGSEGLTLRDANDGHEQDFRTAAETEASASASAAAIEARIPAKKDASLREFLGKMDDYAPIIPDAVTNYYLTLAGLPPPPATPLPLARLLALATQKFVADVAADAYQYSRIRSGNTTSNNPMTGLGAVAGAGLVGGIGGAGMAGGMPGGVGAAGAGVGGAQGGAAGTGKDAKGTSMGVQKPGYGGGGQGGGQGRTVLTMEDLGMAVGEYGVNVKRGEFYR